MFLENSRSTPNKHSTMKTKTLMSSSAVLYAIIGIVLLFMPAESVNQRHLEKSKTLELVLQFLAAFYFSFDFLNWMVKESKIGGL